jgi:hypothetical protein
VSDTQERVYVHSNEQVLCDADGELMQAHSVSSTLSGTLVSVVYVTTLYRCTLVKCRRAKTVTAKVLVRPS